MDFGRLPFSPSLRVGLKFNNNGYYRSTRVPSRMGLMSGSQKVSRLEKLPQLWEFWVCGLVRSMYAWIL